MTAPFRQAHKPAPRWRWYIGLALEVAVLAAAFVAVIALMAAAPMPR